MNDFHENLGNKSFFLCIIKTVWGCCKVSRCKAFANAGVRRTRAYVARPSEAKNVADGRFATPPMKVIFICGGTGGHIYPALAVAAQMNKIKGSVELLFVTSNKSIDDRVFGDSGVKRVPINSPKIPRGFWGVFVFGYYFFKSFKESVFLIREFKPDVVVGFGGYVQVPMLLASFFLGKRTIIHEQNVYPGLANRVMSILVNKIALSFDESRKFFSGSKKIIVTGMPVREDFVCLKNDSSTKSDKLKILVTGGSQGASFINKIFIDTLKHMPSWALKNIDVIHVCGFQDYEFVRTEYGHIGVDVVLHPFFTPMSSLYKEADLVISRAGAGAISEISVCGIASILIPYIYAGNHQYFNAKILSDKAAAIYLDQRKVSAAGLVNIICDLMVNRDKLSEMASRALSVSFPGAAKKLAEEIIGDLKPKKIHLIGIAGYGMSSLARLLLADGYSVSGSDAKYADVLDSLKKMGAKIFVGHDGANVKEADVVVYSSAVTSQNPEIIYAKENNIPVYMRAQMLAEINKDKTTISVCGTHGKSTTSAMIGYLLDKSGVSPSISIGADFGYLQGNAKRGDGKYFVVEADESDGSFLFFSPHFCVVTNIESEHLDFFKDVDSMVMCYKKLLDKCDNNGVLFLCYDCQTVRKIAESLKNRRIVSYGLENDRDIRAVDIRLMQGKSFYKFVKDGKILGEIELCVAGKHNVVNSLAVVGVGLEVGLSFNQIKKVLLGFTGIKRRFEIIGSVDNIIVIDDYAHHPTEIKAVLSAASSWYDKRRVICVCQPHRYSRLNNLIDDFANSFDMASETIVTDVYSAGENKIDGVCSQALVKKIKDRNINAKYISKESLIDELMKDVRAGDIILFLGAGDITYIAKDFFKQLRAVTINETITK